LFPIPVDRTRKRTNAIEKQGGFTRLRRGSHVLEGLLSTFIEERRS